MAIKFKKGDRVFTGYIGTVKYVHDNHNVFVEYDNGQGSGLHCMTPECEQYDPVRPLPKELEEADELSHNNGKGEICSTDICDYCTDRENCADDSPYCFNGRKLAPVS